MSATVRFNTVRLEQKLSRALALAAGDRLLRDYEQAALEVNRVTEERILDSGFGGEHNSEFADQDMKVFRAASGRYNISIGWLNPSDHAKERGSSGRLWYQYADSGFHLFGGSRWIDGVGATIDRRERLIEKIEDINRQYINDLDRELSR